MSASSSAMNARIRRTPAFLPEAVSGDSTVVMGIVNVTPDSFSDGGEHATAEQAIAHGQALLAQGARIIDVGGESTRPGAERVDAPEELRRVLPVVRELAGRGAVVSVDTTRAEVAEACLHAGALIINDVSGGAADPHMAPLCARARTARGEPPVFVVMHWRGHSAAMNTLTDYQDVVSDVFTELGIRVKAALEAGVDERAIVIDPGLGFSKNAEHNWELLAAWEELQAHDLPILIGASRKRFLQALDVDRDHATHALSALSAACGAWAVRVHEVPASVAACAVGDEWRKARAERDAAR